MCFSRWALLLTESSPSMVSKSVRVALWSTSSGTDISTIVCIFHVQFCFLHVKIALRQEFHLKLSSHPSCFLLSIFNSGDKTWKGMMLIMLMWWRCVAGGGSLWKLLAWTIWSGMGGSLNDDYEGQRGRGKDLRWAKRGREGGPNWPCFNSSTGTLQLDITFLLLPENFYWVELRMGWINNEDC